MVHLQPQTAQQFFDRPEVENAKVNLSASAVESISLNELLAISPTAEEDFRNTNIDYSTRHGSPILLDYISRHYKTVKVNNIIVTSGLDDALGMLSLALLEKGDRVVVLSPTYPPHQQLPIRFGASMIPWRATEDTNWIPDLDELRKLVALPTRMVIVGFPQNPTGFMPDGAFAMEMIEIVTNSGAILISDEIYAGLTPGADFSGSNLADKNDQVISLNGLSKTYGLPGLRVGWIASENQAVISKIKATRDLFNAYLPTPIEVLARIALENKDLLYKRNAAIVTAGAEAATEFFQQHNDLFRWTPPAAGVLSFPKWLGPDGARNLSERLIAEASIAFAPGQSFDAGDNNLRLSIGQKPVIEGLDRLHDFLKKNF